MDRGRTKAQVRTKHQEPSTKDQNQRAAVFFASAAMTSAAFSPIM